MSRHVLTPKEGKALLSIAVGWDAPLNTFFASVSDPDDDLILWIGTRWGEIHDHESVLNAVRPYAQIPATLAADLHREANE